MSDVSLVKTAIDDKCRRVVEKVREACAKECELPCVVDTKLALTTRQGRAENIRALDLDKILEEE